MHRLPAEGHELMELFRRLQVTLVCFLLLDRVLARKDFAIASKQVLLLLVPQLIEIEPLLVLLLWQQLLHFAREYPALKLVLDAV